MSCQIVSEGLQSVATIFLEPTGFQPVVVQMKTAHQKLAAATILVLFAVLPLSGTEPLRLANSFGRSMVLQRDMPVPVWGWAPTQAEVAVTFKDQHKTTHADADGRWRVVFEPMPADATPNTLTISCATETVGR